MKSTLKHIGLSIATVSVMSTSSFAVIPVTDAAHIAETAAGWAAEAERWKKTIINYKEELLAKTGIRVGKDFINKFKELKTFLTKNNLDLFDLDLENPKSKIGEYAKALFESQTIFDNCNFDYMDINQKRICKDRMVRGVQELATFSVYKDNMIQSIDRIKTLTDKLGASEDIKGTADINAQINAQMAQLQVQKTQMDMMLANNQAREKVDRIQKEEIYQSKEKGYTGW